MRVEQLSIRSGVSVDTIRYYQSKGLLDPPRRQGRVAWYHQGHIDRLERVRALQQRGFTLATIVRLVSGELDAADEALLGEISGLPPRAGGPGGGTGDGTPAAGTDSGGGTPDGGASVIGAGAPSGAGEPAGAGQPTGMDEPAGMDSPGRRAAAPPDEQLLTIEDLAVETGVPLALLKAVEAEGLLVPRRVGQHHRYTGEDVAAARAGLLLLEWGIPLSALLDLARRHHEATEAVAREAVSLFSTYIRHPLRLDRALGSGGAPGSGEAVRSGDGMTGPDDPGSGSAVDRLLQAYAELLPAVNTLVANHFTRTLVTTALDYVERVGSDAERQAISDQMAATDTDLLVEAGPARSASMTLP